eukprot:375854-Amphidinium_carterae.1
MLSPCSATQGSPAPIVVHQTCAQADPVSLGVGVVLMMVLWSFNKLKHLVRLASLRSLAIVFKALPTAVRCFSALRSLGMSRWWVRRLEANLCCAALRAFGSKNGAAAAAAAAAAAKALILLGHGADSPCAAYRCSATVPHDLMKPPEAQLTDAEELMLWPHSVLPIAMKRSVGEQPSCVVSSSRKAPRSTAKRAAEAIAIRSDSPNPSTVPT